MLEPRAGIGYGVSEAPRGILWHRYEIDAEGAIRDARIVPPTSQNQRAIEEDLCGFVAGHLDLSDDELQWQLRAGDPQLRPMHLVRHPLPEARRGAGLAPTVGAAEQRSEPASQAA